MQGNKMGLQSFCKKVTRIKFGHHFEYKKPFVTPNFCKPNFSPVHQIKDIIFFVLFKLPWEVKKSVVKRRGPQKTKKSKLKNGASQKNFYRRS